MMATFKNSLLDNHSRTNLTTIHFFSDIETGLHVTIDTERLHMCSIESTAKNCNRLAALFGDPEVMEKFATGEPIGKSKVAQRVENWANRWRNNDPYSGFACYIGNTDEFIGCVSPGHGDSPGISEISYLFHKLQWGKGYGSEAVTAIVNEYVPATIRNGYTLENKVLEKIVATARTDNPASQRILEKCGMQKVGTEEKYGATRFLYSKLMNKE